MTGTDFNRIFGDQNDPHLWFGNPFWISTSNCCWPSTGTVSAHAAISFAIALFTARLFRKRWYTVAIFGWALLLAYSRIYLGVHYPMDILLGTALGLGLGAGAFALFGRLMKRVETPPERTENISSDK